LRATVARTAKASQGKRPQAPGTLAFARDPLRISLFLLTIITISRIHQHWRFLAVFRPALVLAFLTAVYAYINPRLIERRGPFYTWPAKVTLALGVLACVSAPFGISLGGSAVFILTEYSKTLIFAFLLFAAIRNASDLYTLFWGYVVSSAILVWMALFLFGLSKASGSDVSRLSSLYTWDANDIGVVLMVGLALTLLMYQTVSGKWKLAAGVIIAGIGATIARSGSRGTFVGLVVFGLALLFTLNQIDIVKRLAFLGLLVLALIVKAPPGYWQQMSTIAAPQQDYNWSAKDGRRQVAERGLGYMLSNPITGLGVHNFWRAECLAGEKVKSRVQGTGIRCTPPHNSYIEAGAETGVPGLVLWCSLVFGGIISCARLRRRLPRSWLKGDPEQRFLYQSTMYLQLAFIGFSVCAFFLTFAWLDIIYMLAAYLGGLYIAIGEKLGRSGQAAPQAAASPRRVRGAPVDYRFATPPPLE
jgi:O-antigen ligase